MRGRFLRYRGDIYRSACAANRSHTFSYALPEGITTLTARARDIVDNQSAARTWSQRIDRSAPRVSVSGSLRDLAGREIEEVAELAVSATDGSTSSASLQRSGVRSVHVYVDGQEQDEPLIQSCTAPAGSCPATRAYTFVAGEFAPGTRRISVVAEDQVGNRSAPIAWDVTVTPGDPQEKMAYGDDGSAPDSYGAVDDGSTACPTDPEAGPEGQYCNADDATNPMDQAVGQEPPVGQERPLLGDLGLLAARDGSDPPTLRPDGRGWGISDQNALTANNRPGGPPENRDLHMFEDPLFKDTNIRSVRRIVPWDVIARGNTPRTEEMGYPDCRNGTTPSQKIGETNVPIRGDQTSGSERSDLDILREWITQADTAGMEIMVSFEHSRPGGSYCYLPTRPEYRAAIRAFRDEFREVYLYTPWNEPNHKTQPTHPRWYPGERGTRETYIGARQAGRYWLDMKKECQREILDPPPGELPLLKCSVGAGDLLDDSTFSPKAFRVSQGGGIFRNYVEGLNGQEPTVWAWHAYSAGYRGKVSGGRDLPRGSERLQRFMEATDYISKTPPKVWLTEQGGRYDLHRNPDFDRLPPVDAEAAADADLEYLFTLPFKTFVESRISRMYIYHWISDPEDLNAAKVEDRHPFDAGLLEANPPPPDGDRGPRSLYFTFKDMVTGSTSATTQP